MHLHRMTSWCMGLCERYSTAMCSIWAGTMRNLPEGAGPSRRVRRGGGQGGPLQQPLGTGVSPVAISPPLYPLVVLVEADKAVASLVAVGEARVVGSGDELRAGPREGESNCDAASCIKMLFARNYLPLARGSPAASRPPAKKGAMNGIQYRRRSWTARGQPQSPTYLA